MGRGKTVKKAPGPLDIDDPNDLFNRQVDAMTRPNPEFRGGGHVWAFYVGWLLPAWRDHVWSPTAVTVSVAAVDRALESKVDWPTLRRIANRISRIDEQTTNDEVRLLLARAIVSRQLWVIRKNNRVAIGKTDPAVLSQLNGQYRASVNFSKLSGWEGGQYLNGYIPFKDGVVYQNSGLTIATGYDMGQVNAKELDSIGLDPKTLEKLTPFAAKPFKNYKRVALLDYISSTLRVPVPEIAKPQADLLDKSSLGKHLAIAINSWDRNKFALVPAFRALPAPWQTVFLSRFFHAGTISAQKKYSRFWTAATAGEWLTAISALRTSDPTFAERLGAEADYLATGVPPAIVKPPKPVVKRP